MIQSLVVFSAGLVFSLGLGVSGMTDANKVIGFLDVSGTWNPSLAFVMIGAIAVHFVLYRLILRRSSPLLAHRFELPTRQDISAPLLRGAGLFGIGWGLGGFCPGPGLVSVVSFEPAAVVFVVSMLGGMMIHGHFAASISKSHLGGQGDMMMIAGLSCLIGLSLGLLGGGGSILAVPVLVYGAGLPIKVADRYIAFGGRGNGGVLH